MSRWLVIFISLLACAEAFGQTIIGRIVDAQRAPLDAVSVVLMDKTGKRPQTFTRTDAQGHFRLAQPKERAGMLIFSLLGYAKDTIVAERFKSGQTIVLKEQAAKIKEVVIQSPRIAQRGDTLTYLVDVFKQQQDRSIANVIAKMPGLQVNDDGTIAYQGRRINKFYIEGMDMLGSKYAQLSENLSADKVKSVQVYENHQQIKMLRGLSFSEQAALNIVLRDDAKNVWQAAVDLGAGSSLQNGADFLCDSRFNPMFFSRKMQMFSLYKFNNCGATLKEAINLRKFFGIGMPETSGFVNNISMDVPDLSPSRTRMNDTHLLSSNWLFKTGKDADLRVQLSGVLDETKVEEDVVTEYTDIATNNRIAESTVARSHRNFANGELLYRVNSDRLYLTNTLSANLSFDRGTGTSMVNGQPQRQWVKPQKRVVADELEMINRLKNGKHLKTNAYLSYNYLPSKLLTAKGTMQELNQKVLFWGATTTFSHPLGKINAQYSIGNEGFTERIEEDNQSFSLLYTQHATRMSIGLFNQRERFSWNVSLPLSLLMQSFSGQDHQRLELEPHLSMTYKPNAHWDFTANYEYSEQPKDGLQQCPKPLFTDYLIQKEGNGQFDNFKMHQASLHAAYKNVPYGLFASLQTGYSYRPDGTLYAHELDGIIYRSIATAQKRSSHSAYADGKITKDIGSKFSVTLEAYFNQSNTYSLVDDAPIPLRFRNLNVAASFSYRPCSWFCVEEKSFLFHTENKREQAQIIASSTNRTNTFNHQLNLFLTPKGWVLQWKNEFYHSNDHSASFNFFSDISVSHQFSGSELSLCLNNLMDNNTYERRVVQTDFITHTIHRLRPREIIIKYLFVL